jgi:hypothetical protein
MYRIENKQDSNFGTDQLKQQLIGYIYNTVDISRFKYELLQFDTELHQLVTKKFFVSANFTGPNCLLVFTKIRDKYHSFMVDRKTLSYNSQKINYEKIKIDQIKLKLGIDIYNGTIFDGTYIMNKKTFVITDIYTFKGQDMTRTQIDTKLLTVFSYLKSNYNGVDTNNSIILTVNKLYNIDQTEHVVTNVIPKLKEFLIKGICFYPDVSTTKLIYLFGNETKQDDKTEKIDRYENKYENKYERHDRTDKYEKHDRIDKYERHDRTDKYERHDRTDRTDRRDNKIPDKSEKYSDKDDSSVHSRDIIIPKATVIKTALEIKYIPKSDKSDYVFEMKKTDISDVYILNAVETVEKHGKEFLKRKKIGHAYIPNVQRSKWCKELIEKHNDGILVKCKFYSEKYKWEPVELSSLKRPNFISDFNVIKI